MSTKPSSHVHPATPKQLWPTAPLLRAGRLWLGLGWFVVNASATPIFITHTGTGTGTIGGIPFTDAAFTITETADTDARISFFGGFYIDDSSADISIAGVGNYHFITGTRTFVNQSLGLVGFSRAGDTGHDLYNGPTSAVFGTWDMLDSIGPITGSGNLLQWLSPQVTTDGGILFFNDSLPAVTFQATIVPEPAGAAMLLCGMAFGLGRRWLRKPAGEIQHRNV